MIASVDVLGIQLSVDCDYQPVEAPTLNYPGCKESVEINAVYVSGSDVDIQEIIGDYFIASIKYEVLEQM